VTSLLLAMKQDLTHVPALAAYSPLLLPPDYPQDNLYYFAFKADAKDKGEQNHVTSFFLQAPSTLLPPSVLLPATSDSPEIDAKHQQSG